MALAAAAGPACRKRAPSESATAASAAASAEGVPREGPGAPASPDRLRSGELPPGTEEVYGLVLPQGMKVLARFPKVVHVMGPLAPEDVSNYVRDHVSASRVELGAVGTVFPNVRVKNGDASKLLRIEVIPLGDRTKLVVEDVTAPGVRVPVDPTLTDAERWRRAGFNPDGTEIDRQKLK